MMIKAGKPEVHEYGNLKAHYCNREREATRDVPIHPDNRVLR